MDVHVILTVLSLLAGLRSLLHKHIEFPDLDAVKSLYT